jgi:protease IV
MSMTADQIVDRRRMRRKLSFWRVTGFLLLIVAVIGGAVLFAGRDAFPILTGPQIARITISGFITDDRAQTELIERLVEADAVSGVIVSINSTGGATTGGEALYVALRKLAEAKPTVATVGTVGASAAYMAAIATDHIVARRTSITGSIGVIFQYPEVSELLDKLGVTVEDIKSAPLKAEPSPFKPTTEEARRVIAGIVRDSFDWFVDIVAERRDMPRGEAVALADGRIYTGRQALTARLIDEIGGEDEAVAWLATQGLDDNLPVRDWKPRRDSGVFSYGDAALLWIAQRVGLAPDLLPAALLERFLPESLKLDGLLSVWQGSVGRDS